MSQFQKLLRLLQKELTQQEKILELLVKERTAIVKLDQSGINKLDTDKRKLLRDAIDLEKQRSDVFDVLQAEHAPESAELKFSQLIELCPERTTKRDLKSIGGSLKITVETVRKMNLGNGDLIKQCMGLIASTVSILTSKPESDLPTYGASGKLKGDEDPAFAGRGAGGGIRRSV